MQDVAVAKREPEFEVTPRDETDFSAAENQGFRVIQILKESAQDPAVAKHEPESAPRDETDFSAAESQGFRVIQIVKESSQKMTLQDVDFTEQQQPDGRAASLTHEGPIP